MKKGQISPSVVTFVAGSIIVLIMVVGLIFLFVTLGTGSEEAQNKAAFRKFISTASASVAQQEVGGAATTTDWKLEATGVSTYYAISFVTPRMAYLFLEDGVQETSSFSKYFDKNSEYYIDKCKEPGDMCYCLFKIKYKFLQDDCGEMDQDAYFMNQVSDYKMTLSNMSEWGAYNIVSLSPSFVEDAKVLDCINMKNEAHCVYKNATGTTGPCVIHAKTGDNIFKPLLWMRVGGGNNIKLEVLKSDAFSFFGGVAPAFSSEDTGGIVAAFWDFTTFMALYPSETARDTLHNPLCGRDNPSINIITTTLGAYTGMSEI